LVLYGAAFLALLLFITSFVLGRVKLPDGPRHFSIFTVIKGYILTMTIMLTTGLSYPFYRQGSSYARLGGTPNRPANDGVERNDRPA
jgi:hypothetical protein